jgi:hypothetical protein
MGMVNLLLLGAGFSHNWGGPLASEVIPYILGSRFSIDRKFVLEHMDIGFEGILELLQEEEQRLDPPFSIRRLDFQDALAAMFSAMNQKLASHPFQWSDSNSSADCVTGLLARFHAIFTLNQDTLVESRYSNAELERWSVRPRWRGWYMPGMMPSTARAEMWSPTIDPVIERERQPFIKLHGSSSWYTADGKQLLVMGGKKPAALKRVPIFEWGMKTFREQLQRPGVALMVIGYGFQDEHINEAICDAALLGRFELFVVDPLGSSVLLGKDGKGKPNLPPEIIKPCIRGWSIRPLRSTFTDDAFERENLDRFLKHPLDG